jgi:hydrophobic/amphiphilic exporter-1 (mainly G- bacteria), HAE1 family
MNISELSVKRPTLIVVIFAALTFLGYMGMRTLNYELLPKWSSPIFIILTPYPGAAPMEVESSVSKKIEDAVAGLPGVDVVRSISQQDYSLVIVSLNTGIEIEPVVNEALRKIQAVKSELPRFALEPSLSQISVSDMPIMTLGISSILSEADLYDLLEERIRPRLTGISGVGQLDILGGVSREIQVNMNQEKMDNYQISILQVLQAIQRTNINYPAGKLSKEQGMTILRMSGKIESLEELSLLVIKKQADGSLIRLLDIAEVVNEDQDATTLYRINGTQSMGIQITKKQDANTVLVSDGLKAEIKKLEKEYQDIRLAFTIPQDGSILIKDAVRGVQHDIFLAILLVSFIMLAFLRSLRNAIIVMISVPLSLVTTIVGITLLDYSLNLMTLLALSLIIGTLVDDAIVVLENVYRHMEMGKSKFQATLDGVKEVSLTVISTSLVLVVVFFPVALSESIISPVIAPFAMVVVFAVLISTFTALTLIPLLTSRFSKLEQNASKTLWSILLTRFEKWINAFTQCIIELLLKALRHWCWTFAIAGILFIFSLALVGSGFIGSEFISMGDVGEGILTVEYPKSYTLKENNLITRQIESYVCSRPEVTGVFSTVGKASGLLAIQSETNKTEICVKLVDKTKRKINSARFFKKLEDDLNYTFTDVKIRSGIVTLVGGADENPIQIVFMGSDKDSLMTFAREMLEQIRQVPGTNNTKLTIEEGAPELLIRFDKEQMALLSISPELAAATIQTAFAGNTENKLKVGDHEYDIHVRLDAFQRTSLDDLKRLTVINMAGEAVKLSQFTEISEVRSSSRLERYDRNAAVVLESQAIGRAVGDVGAEILALLDEISLPQGITYLPEGDLKFQGDAFGSLGMAILIAIVLVYLIMVALYESFLHPLVVIVSIPLSIIGALLALALSHQTLSIFTILGLIMLIGLVTKNAILVVDFINALRDKGISLVRAIISAVRLRIRPILMTAVSTIVGMLPIALSQTPGSEWKNGMGWVLIGGITSALLLSLIVIPVVYLVLEKTRLRIMKRKQPNRLKETESAASR